MNSHKPHNEAASTLPPHRRTAHLGVLAGCVLVLLLSRGLSLHGGHLALSQLQDGTLPDVCFFHVVTGWDCPFCGLTRSFVALAHGEWRLSLSYHRLGWLVFLLLLAQFPYRATLIAAPSLSRVCSARRLGAWTFWVLIVVAAANWIVGWCI